MPEVVAIAVAPGVIVDEGHVTRLARSCLALLGLDPGWIGETSAVIGNFLGADYGVATPEGDAAILEAACTGGWILDRVYTGKAFAGLMNLARGGRWGRGDDVVFWHTGGLPSVFAPGGLPAMAPRVS